MDAKENTTTTGGEIGSLLIRNVFYIQVLALITLIVINVALNLPLDRIKSQLIENDPTLHYLTYLTWGINLFAMTTILLLAVFLQIRKIRKWIEPVTALSKAVDGYTRGNLHDARALNGQGITELEGLYAGIETMRVALLKQFRALNLINLQDNMTGLWNRGYFDERLSFAIRDASLNEFHQFCLFLCDIDYFKAINETYGRLEGDRVLRDVANQIQQNLHKGDTLVRYGGEEFAVIANNTIRYSIDYADQLRLASRFVTVQGQRVSISIGIVEYSPLEHAQTLLERAEKALHQAKQNGRNCVFYID